MIFFLDALDENDMMSCQSTSLKALDLAVAAPEKYSSSPTLPSPKTCKYHVIFFSGNVLSVCPGEAGGVQR